MDVGLEVDHANHVTVTVGVSILVLVDVGLEERKRGHRNKPDYVSILVLVDVGLEGQRLDAHLRGQAGFNPCFSGCWSRRLKFFHKV